MEATGTVNRLRLQYHSNDWSFQEFWSDVIIPQTVDSDFQSFIASGDMPFVVVKQAWRADTVQNILRTHIEYAINENKLDSHTINKMAVSIYNYHTINCLHWASLMSFFFRLGMGYIVQTKITTPGQLIAALIKYYPIARDREMSTLRVLQKESRKEVVEREDCCTWEDYAVATGKYPDFRENLFREMKAEGYNPEVDEETGQVKESYAEWARKNNRFRLYENTRL